MKLILSTLALVFTGSFALKADIPVPGSSSAAHEIRQWLGERNFDFGGFRSHYRITSKLVEMDAAGLWEKTDSSGFSYTGSNGNGLADDQINHVWGGIIWEKDSRVRQDIDDPNGLVLFRWFDNWNGATWENSRRVNFTYTAAKLQVERHLDWNIGTQTFMDNERYIYFYDSVTNQTLVRIEHQTWNGAQWINEDRIVFEYDTKGNMNVVTLQSYVGATVVNDARVLMFFDVDNRIVKEQTQNWNGVTFVDDERSAFVYHANGEFASISNDEWNGTIWVPIDRELFAYNNDDKLEQLNWEMFDGAKWVDSLRNVYEYDANGNNQRITHQSWDGTVWNGVERHTFRFETTVSGITSTPSMSWNVYPNPTSGVVNFESNATGGTLRVFNTQGALLRTTRLDANKTTLDMAAYAGHMLIVSYEVNGEVVASGTLNVQ